ncbi:response regulator [Pararhizobium sp. PWRC1-1]|uniref:response regulator n=1 Tax=Pararhizobium sp. PWRC1-1 TaxID=2804566 RepID=UPI003CF06E87
MSAPLVIVIDDDPGMRWALDALVRSLDFECKTFASAEDFPTSGFLERSSCVVADVRMRGMSGLELAEKLKGTPSDATACPVILVSVFADERMAVLAKDNALVLLKKPFDGDVLAGYIEKAVSLRTERTS